MGAITGEAIRRERRRLNLTAEDAAARYDDPALSHTVLMNIESGRRKTPTTVEEWLRLAYVLGVPPESLLLPEGDEGIEVAPGVVLDRSVLLRWIRGQAVPDGIDERHFRQIAAITLPAEAQRSLDVKQELLRRVGVMVDTIDTETEEVARKTRKQTYDLLSELQELVTSETSREEIGAKIEGYKDRLAGLI
ncbi:helix-turn-helix transcriptional regulator [Longispora sp. NPDC051575]|uniref:helix-turn-helix transcriptional regulator n=1 Tax=Longispora sp. NPDC051575 TaxID=3154943 RepID=UPI00343A27FB